jgi:hypothetical protein
MQYLKSKGISIKTYSDLLERKNITKMADLLCKAFSELLIYDESINLKSIKSNREREVLLNGKNPKYWHELNNKNGNTYKKKRRIFRELVLKHGNIKIQSQVFELLQEKLRIITEITSTTQKRIAGYLLKFNSKSVPEITDLLATNKNNKCTRINHSSIGLKEYSVNHYCIASEINFLK